jgi:hypothetical protein
MNLAKYCKIYMLEGMLQGRMGLFLTVLTKYGACIFTVIVYEVPCSGDRYGERYESPNCT